MVAQKIKSYFCVKKSLSAYWPGQKNIAGQNWQKWANSILAEVVIFFRRVNKIKNWVCFENKSLLVVLICNKQIAI